MVAHTRNNASPPCEACKCSQSRMLQELASVNLWNWNQHHHKQGRHRWAASHCNWHTFRFRLLKNDQPWGWWGRGETHWIFPTKANIKRRKAHWLASPWLWGTSCGLPVPSHPAPEHEPEVTCRLVNSPCQNKTQIDTFQNWTIQLKLACT